MAITQGYRSQTLAGWETDINAALVNPDYYKVPIMTNTMAYTQALNDSAVLTGVRATSKPFFGNKSSEGGLDVPFDADLSAIIFKALCGNATTATAAAAVAGATIPVWAATTAYKIGDLIKDTAFDTGGIAGTYFICTVAGTSGLTEPTWTATAGTSYAVGTATFVASQDFVHTFSVDTTALPYMFVEKSFPDIDKHIVYRGCKINTVSMNVGGDGEMMMGINLMGVRAEDPSAASVADGTGDDTDLTTSRFQFQNFKADLSSTILSVDELAAIRDISLEFNNNLQGDIYTINSRGARREIPEGLMAISGSVNALFEDTSFIAKATGGVEIDLTFSFVEEGHLCRVYLPEVRIEPFDPSVNGPEGVTASFNFRGYRDNNSAAPVRIVVTNGLSTLA